MLINVDFWISSCRVSCLHYITDMLLMLICVCLTGCVFEVYWGWKEGDVSFVGMESDRVYGVGHIVKDYLFSEVIDVRRVRDRVMLMAFVFEMDVVLRMISHKKFTLYLLFRRNCVYEKLGREWDGCPMGREWDGYPMGREWDGYPMSR